MSTMQEVIDLARSSLNDADKVRYSDVDCLKYANAGIGAAYKARPDLRFGKYSSEFVPLALTDTFPLPAHFYSMIADYIGFRCELRDDEAANSGRAGAYLNVFEKQVMTL